MKLRAVVPYVTLLLPLMVGQALAEPTSPKIFRASSVFTIDELPTSGLRKQLEGLTLPVQQKAMERLHSFSFSEHDIEFMGVDNQGAIFYKDPALPENIGSKFFESDVDAFPNVTANILLEDIIPTDVLQLHSHPGAANIVYVNFEGGTIEGTIWNATSSVSSYEAKPFRSSNDTDPNSFSTEERIAMANIWHRIAEDLAPFDIDVTTERPASFGPNIGHILVTSNTDETGAPMPYPSAGGIAYVGVFGMPQYEYFQPALVYYNKLSYTTSFIAEAASHEFGHNLGLSHHGTSTASYYYGHGTGLTSWAPIMGVGYYKNVTQWSKGEYTDANNTQDDLMRISNKLQYRQDDHSNNMLSATALIADAEGVIVSSYPEIDPLNQLPDNKGVIEKSDDIDIFYFDTEAGTVDFSITPAWLSYTSFSSRSGNLDIKATLYDDLGQLITSDPIDNTNAQISLNVPAGRYYLAIEGIGNATTPYSDYGSLGQYYISGNIIPVTPDLTAPNPDPMTWDEAPIPLNKTEIRMKAVEATDDSGFVEYQFVCTSGGLGCVASNWQTEETYTASGLVSGTYYSYRVKARDNWGNETNFSPTKGVRTAMNLPPVSMDDYGDVSIDTTTYFSVMANDIEPEGEALQLYSTTPPLHGSVSILSDILAYTPDSGYLGQDSFVYTVTDGFGGFSASTVTVDVVAPNYSPISNPDSVQVLHGESIVVDVLANDTDREETPLTILSATNGTRGSTALNVDGTITYTATGIGADYFSYVVSDGELSTTGTVKVMILAKLGNSECDTEKALYSTDCFSLSVTHQKAVITGRDIRKTSVINNNRTGFSSRMTSSRF